MRPWSTSETVVTEIGGCRLSLLAARLAETRRYAHHVVIEILDLNFARPATPRGRDRLCQTPEPMSSLISSVAWYAHLRTLLRKCSHSTICRVRRGVSVQHPTKYVLDDQELERVSALARVELEDARKELEAAHIASQSMGKGAEGDEADDLDEDDESAWVE